MEFSFDRSSNEAHLRNSTQSNGPSPKPQTPPQTETIHADGVNTSTIANERLRKAIEKNRLRQEERARMNPGAAQAQQQTSQRPPPPPQANVNSQTHVNEQASFFDNQQRSSGPVYDEPVETKARAHAQERTQTSPKASTAVTRRSAARPNEAEFTPVKRTPRKVASQISYTTTSRKKSKPLDPTLLGYLVKGAWIFCGVMVLRLIFANGGVTDFYSQRSLHNDRLEELGRIKKENMALVHEIERMQTDASFQKKLVRDNLGFIASDEYLVLFPKEN